MIYYGTEIGMTHRHDTDSCHGDSEARQDMPWDTSRWNPELLEFYRSLIRLRRDSPAMRSEVRRTLHLDPEAGTYAYTLEAQGRIALVAAFNVSEGDRTIHLPDAPGNILLSTHERVHLRGTEMVLTPRSGAILDWPLQE